MSFIPYFFVLLSLIKCSKLYGNVKELHDIIFLNIDDIALFNIEVMVSDKDKLVLIKFGEHLRSLREAHSLTYRELSKRSGVNTGDIVKYEKGESGPNLITLKKLAVGFKIHPTQLLNFEFGIDFSEGLE